MNKKIKTYKTVALRQYVFGIAAALLFIYLMVLLFAWMIRPDTANESKHYSPEAITEVNEARNMPEKIDKNPRVSLEIPATEYAESEKFFKKTPDASLKQVEKAITDGKLPKWYPRQQAPVLDPLVKAGKLPPVAERVGPEPVVMRGCDSIGKYGGTWTRVANSANDVGVISWRLSYSDLVRFSPMADPIVPHVAKKYWSEDNDKVWYIKLRKIRWSDGHPLTADDVLFHLKYLTEDKVMGGSFPQTLVIQGQRGKYEKIDDLTIKFTFPVPYGNFIEQVARRFQIDPSHYLMKYHPTYGDQELIKKEMENLGLSSARTLYYQMVRFDNPECPRLWPWIYRQYKSTPPQVFVRNPYYFAVDEKGNQLPYIDRVQFEVMDDKMLCIAAANGKISMQNRFIRFENYTDLMSRREESGTKVLHWVPATRSDWLIMPNQNRKIVPEKPETKWKKQLLSNKKFRQALSMALDRKQIINAMFMGLSKPVQVEPGPFSQYHSPKLANAFVQYDPKKANAMLDALWREAGADPDKRVNGYRCTPDGKLLTFYLDFCEFNGLGPAEFVIADWGKVGIRCIYRNRARSLFSSQIASLDFDFSVWTSETDSIPMVSPRSFMAIGKESPFGRGWGSWYSSGGLYDSPKSKNQGMIPVPEDHPMHKSMMLYEEAKSTTSLEKRQKCMQQILDIAAENLWTINVCSAPPGLVIADADMQNIPEKAMVGAFLKTPGNSGIETYFFNNPDDSGINDTIDQLSEITPIPRSNDSVSTSSSIIKYLLLGIGLLVLVMICISHPFILRRLLIMIPTLWVISICVFVIIQLPPGDFLSVRMMQMEESGENPEIIEMQIKELKHAFHIDDPAWKRYLRWVGAYWFVSYKAEDEGLLQGNMGRSMETSRSVNSMVGDRIMLTFLISLGTVLFTWALAIPIGIYSAVRQYSIGDYVFTILGFLGMCIPPFLLALILIALTGISGLFSPEYAIQPEWDIGKVIDLLKHIWIPILVMGVSGTAGMIRVMRANLLDELKKPYVVTARAKGMRSMKLLFKYPVRLALNPFVSGIGGLFPMLVSGSTIVAIVMSLPTVGPLMLTALFSQDMNMAGSMLMVLSLLGVFGTLVSDILLLAIDPRIRIGGGE